jgi:hypothetical protein
MIQGWSWKNVIVHNDVFDEAREAFQKEPIDLIVYVVRLGQLTDSEMSRIDAFLAQIPSEDLCRRGALVFTNYTGEAKFANAALIGWVGNNSWARNFTGAFAGAIVTDLSDVIMREDCELMLKNLANSNYPRVNIFPKRSIFNRIKALFA